jgi:hypothetical protein
MAEEPRESAAPAPGCSLCGQTGGPLLALARFGGACLPCVCRLGRLLQDAPGRLQLLWPALGADEDEEDEPEPKIRLPDGSSVELREQTAKLKEELSVPLRLELAETFNNIGLQREMLGECAFVMTRATEAPPDVTQRAVDLFLAACSVRTDFLEQLSRLLFPN